MKFLKLIFLLKNYSRVKYTYRMIAICFLSFTKKSERFDIYLKLFFKACHYIFCRLLLLENVHISEIAAVSKRKLMYAI